MRSPFITQSVDRDFTLTRERIELGKLGEELACKEIKKLGYKKILRNYRCPLGEIDIIARDGETFYFGFPGNKDQEKGKH